MGPAQQKPPFQSQCGFSRHRSNLDNMVNLEHKIHNSFLLRQHLVAVFFELQKAYNITWRYGALRTLRKWNLRGRLPQLFISNFLQELSFHVRLGNV